MIIQVITYLQINRIYIIIYIIGYWNAQQWLDKHGISVFEALETIRKYEEFNFGECKSYTNAEETVNMLVYIYGEELLLEMELI